ncbi:MAG TPA: methyltransferase domain-containing protein [Polyangia bacterium]|nr:methyltransferase domain-containing protein [Polyangia bacterium]
MRMLIARAVSLASRRPTSKRWLWRGWYQFLAGRYRAPGWTFMNYGYRAPGGAPLALAPEDEPDRSFIQLYDTVAGAAPLAGRDVLEVGCGRGGGASFVARYHRPRGLVAVDLAPRAVALCRARFAIPGLSFEVGDAERLPFAAATFDAVLNVESSHCYGRIGDFFREARRVLRPGGSFLYADFRPREELDAWRAALRDAGFRIDAERDLTPGVVAALDADDAGKRSMIAALVDRPLAGVFRQFAGLRGTAIYEELRAGALAYRAFTATA